MFNALFIAAHRPDGSAEEMGKLIYKDENYQ